MSRVLAVALTVAVLVAGCATPTVKHYRTQDDYCIEARDAGESYGACLGRTSSVVDFPDCWPVPDGTSRTGPGFDRPAVC